MKKITVFLFAGMFLFLSAQAYSAESLYQDFSRRGVVKVFVDLPKDSTGKDKVATAELKTSIEEALTKRKSISFSVVPGRESADITIDTEVNEYYWTEHDPVDMIMGVGAAAMDAAKVDHYVRIQAAFTISDAKSGKVLWKDRLRATVTDHSMTEQEAIQKVNPDMAKNLVIEAFGKKSKR